MGSAEDAAPEEEKPQHQVDLPAYRIGKFPVTNRQYLEYVRQTGVAVASETGWKLARVGKAPDKAKLAHPIVGISWDEALAYCHWLSQQTGRHYRLPTEAEWEKAARGAGRCPAAIPGVMIGSRDAATAAAPAQPRLITLTHSVRLAAMIWPVMFGNGRQLCGGAAGLMRTLAIPIKMTAVSH